MSNPRVPSTVGEEPGLLKDRQALQELNLREPFSGHLVTAMRSLLSDVSARLVEFNTDVGRIISEQEKIVQSFAAQELGKEALKPSVPAEDICHLRNSVTRIRRLIEQVSDQLMKSIEECDKKPLLSHWYLKTQTSKELYICSVVSQKMFSGFENENFMLYDGALPILDLHTLRNESRKKFRELRNMSTDVLKLTDSLFLKFASERRSAILSEFEKSEEVLISSSYLLNALKCECIDERLDDLAKEVWAMHKLALSIEWPVRILRVQKGALFDETLMEAVISPPHDDEHGVKRARFVEHMVMPGFHVLDTHISPCRVSLK